LAFLLAPAFLMAQSTLDGSTNGPSVKGVKLQGVYTNSSGTPVIKDIKVNADGTLPFGPTETPTLVPTIPAGSLTPTPTKTPTLIVNLGQAMPVASQTPVAISTPRAGYYTGLLVQQVSNPGTVAADYQLTLNWTAVGKAVQLAPAGGLLQVPYILWDNGVHGIQYMPPSQATTLNGTFRWIYWDNTRPVPHLGLPSSPSGPWQ
jgi:hypothetical protein